MSSFFSGKTVLVTGASKGIGEAIARILAADGANLILVARSAERLNALQAEWQATGSAVEVEPCDLSKPDQVRTLGQKLAARDRPLDGAVFNAGAGLYGEGFAVGEEDVREMFELNLFSIRSLIAALLPRLQKGREPRIVLVSSVVSWRAIPRLGLYCATKGALNLFAEALRVELKPLGVKVTNTYPGRTGTDFSKNAKSSGGRAFPHYGGTAPEKVARRIVSAMRRGKRDAFISVSNRFLIWWNFYFPRSLDWILGRVLK